MNQRLWASEYVKLSRSYVPPVLIGSGIGAVFGGGVGALTQPGLVFGAEDEELSDEDRRADLLRRIAIGAGTGAVAGGAGGALWRYWQNRKLDAALRTPPAPSDDEAHRLRNVAPGVITAKEVDVIAQRGIPKEQLERHMDELRGRAKEQVAPDPVVYKELKNDTRKQIEEAGQSIVRLDPADIF